jgi:hypothetical protein
MYKHFKKMLIRWLFRKSFIKTSETGMSIGNAWKSVLSGIEVKP